MKTTIIKQVNELTATFQPEILKPCAKPDLEFKISADITAMFHSYGEIGDQIPHNAMQQVKGWR